MFIGVPYQALHEIEFEVRVSGMQLDSHIKSGTFPVVIAGKDEKHRVTKVSDPRPFMVVLDHSLHNKGGGITLRDSQWVVVISSAYLCVQGGLMLAGGNDENPEPLLHISVIAGSDGGGHFNTFR